MKRIRLGTRKSGLALIQADMVKRAIAESNSNVVVEIVRITTEGDMQTGDTPVESKGMFVKTIEEKIISGEIDAGVHSVKDMPALIPEGLLLAAFLKREDARDVFISLSAKKLNYLPNKFTIGTSSQRRKAFLLNNYKNLKVVNIRGNVDTRLKKLQQGEVDGLILAAAGIIRLGHHEMITEYLDRDKFVPSAGQGAIGIEISSGNRELSELMQKIDNYETRISVSCERAFISEIGAGCNVPVGVHCEMSGKELSVKCAILSSDGKEMLRGEIKGDISSAEYSGIMLARKMIDRGAVKFFKN